MKEIMKMSTKTLFLTIAVSVIMAIAAKISAVTTGTPEIAWSLGTFVIFGVLYEGTKQVMEHRKLMKEVRTPGFRTTLEQRAYMAAKRRNANRMR
jgi:hypothetical protein